MATVVFYAVIVALIVFPDIGRTPKNILLGILVAAILFAAVVYLIKLLKAEEGSVYENKNV